MEIIYSFIFCCLTAIVLIPFLSTKWKGIITVISVSVIAILSSIIAINSFLSSQYTLLPTQFIFPGSAVTGDIVVRTDTLSAWFILIINFGLLTGGIYGYYYMKVYREQKANLTLHCIAYILMHASLISITVLQNSLAFLFAWEIMALTSFILIIFEHNKQQTIKAGLNFLVQSHISLSFLMIGFLWVAIKMNSYDFTEIIKFSLHSSQYTYHSTVLFILFFTGFAIKAGFVPFHTWLPYAHPAAPAHVSGVMSGVIIKIGIYGILRMMLLIKCDFIFIGYIILTISVISGVYGVMLAIIQHNLKKLLAYHSIENIGIIGIGIGIGCIGIGNGNIVLITMGIAGAILHTLNHSLFKSLLFYGAGNIYQTTHTMNIEKLGGIIKRMPHTATLFLVASLAICGLPPFNGFVSEFFIYSGIFNGFQSASFGILFSLVFSLFGLALIGGMAMLCFTKAFGIVFLGSPRDLSHDTSEESGSGKLIPMYAVGAVILAIGVFPKPLINLLSVTVSLFIRPQLKVDAGHFSILNSQLTMIGLCASGLIVLSGLIFYIKKLHTKMVCPTSNIAEQTWGCGYGEPNRRMQYTATSYIRTYRKLAEPLLLIFKKKEEINGMFPKSGWHETHPYDKFEKWFIDRPLQQMKYFINRFGFLQNGKLQFYIIYGVLFIILILIMNLFI